MITDSMVFLMASLSKLGCHLSRKGAVKKFRREKRVFKSLILPFFSFFFADFDSLLDCLIA